MVPVTQTKILEVFFRQLRKSSSKTDKIYSKTIRWLIAPFPLHRSLTQGNIVLQRVKYASRLSLGYVILSPSPPLSRKTKPPSSSPGLLAPFSCFLPPPRGVFRAAAGVLPSQSINLIITLPGLKSSKGFQCSLFRKACPAI